MPFSSESQRKLCWVKYNQDIRDGRKPSWDCSKWSHDMGKKISKSRRSRSKRRSKRSNSNPRKRSSKLSSLSKKDRESMRRQVSKTRKIYTGLRGGKYVLVKGKKIYV